ncbi:tyrosine-type recombinase/integrase [Bacillus mycoides]|uniref:tyrosine-type recombinase/integrase n=1 Tax=Bacillus mycoides TaxID=1405 RepID=UPI002DFB507A|nr:tyrosine-type recombinase/integrase [Bacillus mycoides]MEC5238672.1 tyrosine-type recombinase/integrase [Bacillus mycoides]MEC5265174.1 tyrosine-type recombinase/integrase [Bacillus mycoides]
MDSNHSLDFSSTSTHYNESLRGTLQDRINSLKDMGVNLTAEASNNRWNIYDEYFSQTHFVDFSFDSFSSKKFDMDQFILLLKSWLILHLEDGNSFQHLTRKIRKVKDALILSKGFNLEAIDEFELHYFSKNLKPSTLQGKASFLLEFLDFCQDLILPEEYLELILRYYQIQRLTAIRKLPSSQDVLKFSLIVEVYFSNEEIDKEYLDYYPIYLWWNLTNIIPIRINEFCNLKFDCLNFNKEGYFLSLPRSKNLRNRKMAYDKILISDKISNSIELYQQKIYSVKPSKTLLQTSSTVRNIKPEIFNYRNFRSLLDKFYREIVCGKYGLKLLENSSGPHTQSPYNIHRKIRPNDTRHFAFLNLMLQGYHPSEIARLGGHNSVYSQMTYHNHLEYWIDSELIKLLTNQKRHLGDLSNEFFKEIIFKNAMNTTMEVSEVAKIPLEIGYCTDPLQDCPVDEHYLCKHWRITLDDYQKHYDKLQNVLVNQESVLKLCIDKLLALHKTGLIHHKNDAYDEKNSQFNYQLIESSKKVKDALYQLAKLKERFEMYEKSRA